MIIVYKTDQVNKSSQEQAVRVRPYRGAGDHRHLLGRKLLTTRRNYRTPRTPLVAQRSLKGSLFFLTMLILLAHCLAYGQQNAPQAAGRHLVRGGLDPQKIRQITDYWKGIGWSCDFAAPTISINLDNGEISPRTFTVHATFRSNDGTTEAHKITQTIVANPKPGAHHSSGLRSWSGKRKWALDSSLYSGATKNHSEGQGNWSIRYSEDGCWYLDCGNGVGGYFGDIPFRLKGTRRDPLAPIGPAVVTDPVDNIWPSQDFVYMEAYVMAVSGTVELYRNPTFLEDGTVTGEHRRLAKGRYLFHRRDVLKSDDRGRAMILFPHGGSRLALSPSSLVMIKSYRDNVIRGTEEANSGLSHKLFRIFKGSVKYVTGKLFGTGKKPQFRTNHGACGIRGTNIIITHDPALDRDDLYVLEGEVEWTTDEGTKIVKQGQQLTTHRGGLMEDVKLLNMGEVEATGLLEYERQVLPGPNEPSLEIKKIWIDHNTHLTVPPWWEKGTPWQGAPAMTVYTNLCTSRLKGKKVGLEVTFRNPDGTLVRWKKGAPPHITGTDGVLRPAWMDIPSGDPFEYAAFRIPIPYSSFDESSITGKELAVILWATSGEVVAIGETRIDTFDLKQHIRSRFR